MSKKTKPRPPLRSRRQRELEAQRQAARERKRRLTMIAGVAGALAVAALVVLIVIIATRPGAEVDFNGVALAEFDASAGRDAAVATKAPLFVTEDIEGARVVTGGGAGPADTAKIFVFLGGDCNECGSDLGTAAAWLEDNELPELVEIITVSSGYSDSVEGYEEVGWTLPVLLDDGVDTTAELFGITETPMWVVLNNNNFVVTRQVGPLSIGEFQALVDLAETAFI